MNAKTNKENTYFRIADCNVTDIHIYKCGTFYEAHYH